MVPMKSKLALAFILFFVRLIIKLLIGVVHLILVNLFLFQDAFSLSRTLSALSVGILVVRSDLVLNLNINFKLHFNQICSKCVKRYHEHGLSSEGPCIRRRRKSFVFLYSLNCV